MKKLRLLLTMIIVLAAVGVQAQNTGVKPYVFSTHTYTITKGMINSDLAWSVTNGTRGLHFDFVQGDGTVIPDGTPVITASVNVLWKVANTAPDKYTLQVQEKRNGLGIPGCPTTRDILVEVVANAFDVIAELVTPTTECATLTVNPVVDVDTDNDGAKLGDNSDDIFGTTTREFKVKMTGGDASRDWSFEYLLTDIADDFKLDDVTSVTLSAGTTSSAGSLGRTKISVDAATVLDDAGVPYVTLSIAYSTNKNIDGTNGQDPDVDLELAIFVAKDALGTPDSDELATSNVATHTIYAVPATTGIITD